MFDIETRIRRLFGRLRSKATDFREYQGDEQREDRFWS